MELQAYWEALFNDGTNPCCISNLREDSIVFMNLAMKKMLQEFGDVSQRKCYEIIQSKGERCSFCPNDRLEFAKIEENYIYNDKLDQYFRVNHTLLEYDGERYNLCKYFLAPSFQQQQLGFEEAMHSCEKISKLDTNLQIPHFLELLGKYYNCDQAYIYLYQPEIPQIDLEMAWKKGESVVLHPKFSPPIPTEKLLSWFSSRNEVGIVEANPLLQDFHNDSLEAQILDILQLENLVLCHLGKDPLKIDRMIGLCNRKETGFDYRLLKAVCDLIFQVGQPQEMEKTLNYVKDFDFLTGFSSRYRYSLKVDQLKQEKLDSLGVLYISMNGLRKINAAQGSAQGDRQVRNCAKILIKYFGNVFYRISSGDFVGFFENITVDLCQDKLVQIRSELKTSCDFSFSMGHIIHHGRIDVGQALHEAETMMKINKQQYYHRVRFDEKPSSHILLNDLLRFLKNGEFLVYLQPQMNLLTGEIIGAEALIRRYDKQNQKMIFPDQFISNYEYECIIRHIDIYVVEKICQILSSWKEAQLPISVNLSRVTLLESDIVEIIADICDQYAVDHSLIIIEVTERVGLIENDVGAALITKFRDNGFKISLDDFGCAYSNIVTLAKIEVNEVKIDKSLVDELTSNVKNQMIVENVLNMCNSFHNTHTLAEGIEDAQQAEMLRAYGCTFGQGYFYARPMPWEQFQDKYITIDGVE